MHWVRSNRHLSPLEQWAASDWTCFRAMIRSHQSLWLYMVVMSLWMVPSFVLADCAICLMRGRCFRSRCKCASVPRPQVGYRPSCSCPTHRYPSVQSLARSCLFPSVGRQWRPRWAQRGELSPVRISDGNHGAIDGLNKPSIAQDTALHSQSLPAISCRKAQDSTRPHNCQRPLLRRTINPKYGGSESLMVFGAK